MKAIIQKEERRQSRRFKVQGMVLAVSHPHARPPGSIKEISRNGVVFQYRENGNNWGFPRELDIIWADYVAAHHLEKIPVRIVSDVFINKEENNNESVTRRQALAFDNLSHRQENQLGQLIRERGTISL